jgi:dolichol-phosphate mannosyltransferase
MNSPQLYVVMPVFNEEASVAGVLVEWTGVLRALGVDFVIEAIDDGSQDSTHSILQGLQSKFPELRITAKPNTGHGQSCLVGYRNALQAGVPWIFQIDSDGQCEPLAFESLWRQRESAAAHYGYRWPRHDGFHRFVFSRVVGLVTYLASGEWVADPNTPYRLMSRSSLEVVSRIPQDFHLANVALAMLQTRFSQVRWHSVPFRQRSGGSSSQKLWGFARRAWQLFVQVHSLSAANRTA